MIPLAGDLHWPTQPPEHWWRGAYADIRERIRKFGYLETEEIWLPNSDDSWAAFCRWHGTTDFELDQQTIERGGTHRWSAEAKQRNYEKRWGDRIRQQQEQWEAERRQRQLAKQARADWEWQNTENAKRWWSHVHPPFAHETYHPVTMTKGGYVNGIRFEAGIEYWVPRSVMIAIVNAKAGNKRHDVAA